MKEKKTRKAKSRALPSLVLILELLGASLGITPRVWAEGKKTFLEDLKYYQAKQPRIEAEIASSDQRFLDDLIFYLPPGPSKEYQREVGQKIVGLLKKECSYVNYYIMERQKGEHELVVRCYQKDEDGYWPEWGVNAGRVCEAYVKTNTFLGIRIESWLVTSLAGGETNSKEMSYDRAKKLEKVLDQYSGEHNAQNCVDWQLFLREMVGAR